MKNPVLSLFDKIHLNEGGALAQMWILIVIFATL